MWDFIRMTFPPENLSPKESSEYKNFTFVGNHAISKIIWWPKTLTFLSLSEILSQEFGRIIHWWDNWRHILRGREWVQCINVKLTLITHHMHKSSKCFIFEGDDGKWCMTWRLSSDICKIIIVCHSLILVLRNGEMLE